MRLPRILVLIICYLADPSPAQCWQWPAAMQLAQTLNQQYVVSNQTSVQMWTPIYSWYEWLPYKGKVSTRILGRRTAPFHLSLFLTASRMVLPQDPSTDPNCALLGRASWWPTARGMVRTM